MNYTHLFVWHFVGFSYCFRHMDCSLPSGEIATVKIGHQRYQHCQFLLMAKACMHEMAMRRNDKSPSVMVWPSCWAAQQPTRPMWCQMATAHWTSKALSSSRCHLHQARHRCRTPVDSKRERIYVDTTDTHTMKCQQFRAITWTAFESSIWLAYIYWRVV